MNDNNEDEYQLSDPEMSGGLDEVSDKSSTFVPNQDNDEHRLPSAKRNIIITIGIIFILMLGYKIIGPKVIKKPTVNKAPPAPINIEQPIIPAIPIPVATIQKSPTESFLNRKLAAFEVSQETLRADATETKDAVNTINTNLSNLTDKITQLNQIITDLSSKVDMQASEITRLTVKPKKHILNRKHALVRPIYYIQAVIPGRAWLIATNGNTLTVREGTPLPGYGFIRSIDATGGRVTTSSGIIIRFSQQDS